LSKKFGSPGEITRGWRVIATATIGCGLGASSLPFYSFGSFVIPLTNQFGWSRGQLSVSLLFMTLALAVMSPLIGGAIDRYGVRKIALVSIPLLACVFFLLSLSTGSLSLFYICFAAISVIAGGTTPINYTRAINQHFVQSRGLALGLTLAGLGVAAIALPLLTADVVQRFGWRAAYQVIGLLALAAWPIMFFGLERCPSKPKLAVRFHSDRDFLRDRVFWTVAVTCFFVSGVFAGLVVHLVPYLRDAGLSATKAATFAAFIGVGGIVGRLSIGYLVDRLFAPYVAAAAFAATSVGCMLLATYGAVAAPVAAVVIGISFGAEVDIVAYLVVRYFGIRRYGMIYGLSYSCFAVGAAMGPALGGALFDATRSYSQGIWFSVVVMLGGAVAMLSLPPFPGQPDVSAEHVADPAS